MQVRRWASIGVGVFAFVVVDGFREAPKFRDGRSVPVESVRGPSLPSRRHWDGEVCVRTGTPEGGLFFFPFFVFFQFPPRNYVVPTRPLECTNDTRRSAQSRGALPHSLAPKAAGASSKTEIESRHIPSRG
ncbi:hypothetical protein K505DRAFT_6408 [Melanomma pulvis-pyrius CBS 109.77]|uniref:Secreted protein n=1 Tax=Melanomma pulvis-pyrius CBS 109.77 TaxID=1314802 RepID=A0A6A6WNS1_9PLEO|nr:hypothetical protein K505DRAFT_6408 [Melanomma pulvis-pyrius CBS 109.77]